MQVGSLIKFKDTTEFGIVIEKIRNQRWVIIGLTNHVGFRYETSSTNRNLEILCK
jgi:hypothetical protein